MSTRRGYDLVCPIARALDRVGDRWTLLILRDLHAGPARFSDLETGLGIASNLLSSRLRDLNDDGLVATDGDPSSGTACRCIDPANGCCQSEETMIEEPSGDQPTQCVVDPQKVMRRAGPPAVFITKMSS